MEAMGKGAAQMKMVQGGMMEAENAEAA